MPTHSITYSFPYLFVIFILFILFLSENKKIPLFSIKVSRNVAFMLMLGFIGLRGHLYSDFISYYPFFEYLPTIDNLSWSNLNNIEGFEVGFVLYSSLIKTLFPNYFVWIFVNTLIDLYVFRLAFRRYSYSEILPFIFFMAWQGLAIEFNLYRNSKAIILFLLSLHYLEERKALPYFMLNLLGLTFHTSALLYFPLYFILHRQYSKKILWICIIGVNVFYFISQFVHLNWGELLGFLGNERALMKLEGYQDRGVLYGFSIGYFERTFVVILAITLYDKLIEQNSTNRIMINSLISYYALFLVFSNVAVLAERIPLLLIFSYWILLSNIFYLYRLRWNIPVLIITLLMVMKVIVGNSQISCYYDNLLWGIKEYQERYSMVMNILLEL